MWQSMSKEELEKQYSANQWTKRMSVDAVIDSHHEFSHKMSEKVRSEVQHTSDIPYGPTDMEKLDLFVPDHLPKDAPILVFIHGGSWAYLCKNDSCYMAGVFTKAGTGVAVVEYELAPKAKLDTIVAQCHGAVKYVLDWAAKRGSRAVYLCGHSAGGHLVAMMATYDYKKLLGDKAGGLLKGVAVVSGLFDVRPIVHTTINDPLKMTEESFWNNSPEKYMANIIKYAKGNGMDFLIAAGENDSPEFKRQSKEFAESLKAGGVNVKHMVIPEVDHFNGIELVSDENYVITKEIVKLMKL